MATERCLAEAVERSSAVFSDEERLIVQSWEDLEGKAVHPSAIHLISTQQYEGRAAWNSSVDADHEIPEPFDESQKVGWVAASVFGDSQTKLVPAGSCFLGYPRAMSEGFPIPDSSGLAAGDTLDEAIERGLLELIERDAVAIWWYGRIRRPPLLISEDPPLVRKFAAWAGENGRRFWLLDLTNDLGVPVAVAVSCDRSGRNISLGSGAGWTIADAAESALGELVQFEISKVLMLKTGTLPIGHLVTWCIMASVNEFQFLLPSPSARAVPIKHKEMHSCMETLRAQGVDPLVVDLSRPHLDRSVARVLAPGLRHIWPRFAPGRLYDVPYKLGWHDQMMTEVDLNPVSILY
jgi:ribosomal protein S12 methylthiotransferase accessory factor